MNTTIELDLFTDQCIDTRSVPPWLDPQKVRRVSCDPVRDRDHVGENEIGRLGNDATVWIVTAEARDGTVLHGRTFREDEKDAAWRYLDELLRKIDANRQGDLGL